MKKPAQFLLIIFLAIVLVFFQYRLWFAKDGAVEVFHFKKMLAVQSAKNHLLEQQNNYLRNEIAELKNNGEAVEEYARSDLGMIKEGEVFYRVVH